ncbi:NnrU family protein [uncultured Rhodospira sp.]|uniref:NnrU family protein n=1 Tax=uncultured Rhodospira sp. TaxID=1936189 RepID=UPI00260E8698|nr:NnrU family protein [uncultured Rhodospira sp.]
MTAFLLALTVFLAAHMVPSMPPVRRALVARLGERGYLAVYAGGSTVLLVWLIVEALRAPYVHVWTAPAWVYAIPAVVMPGAFVLLCAGLLTPNPLSVSLSRAPFDPARPGVAGLARHPVLWGFGLWSLSHMPANGSAVLVILFGVFTAFSFGGMGLVDAKRKRTMGKATWAWLDAARRAGRGAGLAAWPTVAGTALGLGLYALFLFWAHTAWIGVSPLPLWPAFW